MVFSAIALIGRLGAKIRRKTAGLTDTRIGIVSDIIVGIKVIKMYAWEKPYWQRLQDTRKYSNNMASFVMFQLKYL